MIPPITKLFVFLESSSEYVISFLESLANAIQEREPEDTETIIRAAQIIKKKRDVLTLSSMGHPEMSEDELSHYGMVDLK